jgi:hypothetical protein
VQKLVYLLWQDSAQSADSFRDRLLRDLAPRLAGLESVHGIRLAVADSEVAGAASRRMESHPPLPNALLSLWVDSVSFAASWQSLIEGSVERCTGYLVEEAVPLESQQRHVSLPGDRVYGMCQVAFLRKPVQLERVEWLAIWQGSHTPVAIETQSTFGYRQNVIVRGLDEQPLPFDAIVEENFPPQAMACNHAFYDTGGDEELLQQRMNRLLESCARFIDFQHIDVVPMSEYLIK